MIVFYWLKYSEHSNVILKEYAKKHTKDSYFYWKSTIYFSSVTNFRIDKIDRSKINGRYEIFTNHGIFESDEIETASYGSLQVNNSHESTWR